MTETLTRPAARASTPAGGGGSGPALLRAGAAAAGWALVAGLVLLCMPVVLVWAADARSGASADGVLRAVGQIWLLAHGASLSVPEGELGVVPLGLTVLPLLLLARATAHAARQRPLAGPAAARRLVAAVAAAYATGAAVISAASGDQVVRPAPVEALLGGLAVGALGASIGVARVGGFSGLVPGRVPAVAVRVAAAAAGAVTLLLGAGAVLVGLSLALHFGQARELAGHSSPGVVGGFALLVIGAALAPNASIWGASWLAGPGFSVGVGTAIGPFAHSAGAVPALPLLAALPAAPAPGWAGVVGVGVVVVSGLVAGVLLVRRHPAGTGYLRAAAEACAVAVAAGAGLAALAALSGGAAGGERLAAVGPSPWQVGLVVAAEVAAGAVPVALAGAWWRSRR